MRTEQDKYKKIQVVKYGCCGEVFAACREPECYTDKDWIKQLRKYVLAGDTVEMAESARFGKCECKQPSKEQTLSLFDYLPNEAKP